MRSTDRNIDDRWFIADEGQEISTEIKHPDLAPDPRDEALRLARNQRKRANTILLDVFDGDQAAFSAADVAIVAAALDEAELRGKREGLRLAKEDAIQETHNRLLFNNAHERGAVCASINIDAAITARIMKDTAP